MAATSFIAAPTVSTINPHELSNDHDETTILTTISLPHHTNIEVVELNNDSEASNSSSESSSCNHEEENEDGEEEEVHKVEVLDSNPADVNEDEQPLGNVLIGQRVTLKPRRTLSLSPTPGRACDMMARNLRAARWLDFTNDDDDDGLYQLSDSDMEGKIKKTTICAEETRFGGIGKLCLTATRRGGSLTLGAMTASLNREFLAPRRACSTSMKRPLEVTLPCQEIQYLDISYQKVGIHSVQFSPITRKKISYHPVPYHAIHYCDVPYIGERPVKRKPPA